MKPFAIVKEPIDPMELIRYVMHPNAGAVNIFLGTVREMTKGRRTLHLEYAAYETMAEKKLAQIGDELKEKYGEIRTAIHHRTGRLEIGEIAVAIAVSAPHRADSFAACRHAIERIKEMVPIWKKEFWEDGESWIGDQRETVSYPSGMPEMEEEREDD